MAEPQFREATADDAEPLVAVYHSAYRENRRLGFPAKAESVTAGELREWIEDHRVYVASVDGQVVGGVRLETTDPGRVKLSRLGVHEDWKGEGIGTALLNHAEAEMADDGVETIWLTTPGEHPYLPDLYRARGYEKTGTYPLEYRDYDEVVMEKRLR